MPSHNALNRQHTQAPETFFSQPKNLILSLYVDFSSQNSPNSMFSAENSGNFLTPRLEKGDVFGQSWKFPFEMKKGIVL